MEDAQAKFDEAVAELTEVCCEQNNTESVLLTTCILGMGKSLRRSWKSGCFTPRKN